MKLLAAIRRVWRRRILLVVAVLLAGVVGVAITRQIPSLKTRQYQVGIASASALIDTSRSQVGDLSLDTGSDVGTLAARASLLANLMATSQIKDDIARRAGISPSQLIATPPAAAGVASSSTPDVPLASANPSSPKASILNISVPSLQAGIMPIILVGTQAATPALAARLANAAFAALQADVDSVAAADKVPGIHRLAVRQLGPAVSGLASRGPGMVEGVLGAVVTFLLICGAFIAIPSLRAAWRRAGETETDAAEDDSAPAERLGVSLDEFERLALLYDEAPARTP
jgi:hypothetical protein